MLRIVVCLGAAMWTAFAAEGDYAGAHACSGCHAEIAASQAKTNMARTWQGSATAQLPPGYARSANEGETGYHAARSGEGLRFDVTIPGRAPFSAPVQHVVGGERHGLSFLFRVGEIEGARLARPVLVEGRYLHGSEKGSLLLSPGFPEEPAATYESALGRALSAEFEGKCLTCHGAPKAAAPRETGVRCENCHGPAKAHIAAVATGKPRSGVVNPKRLSPAEQMDRCAACHAGFGDLHDSVPGDLLISNQVNALKRSQCQVQSGAAFSCTACHDPHRDGGVQAAALKTCLGCHGRAVANRAGLCPVNEKGDCLGCHMPQAQKGSFHMVDHWIRVHPEQGVESPGAKPEHRSTVRPRVVNLRLIATADRAAAEAAYTELRGGRAFFEVAQRYSKDQSALSGGFLGEMSAGSLDARILDAVLGVERGGFSPVVEAGGRFLIAGRMPRDFLFLAEQEQRAGSELRQAGKLEAAIEAYTRALRIYPRFLRALVFLGATYGDAGNPARGAAVLEYAARLYPADPAAQYNLGNAYEALGRAPDAIRAYRRAIELQPDLLPAYLNLGGALFGMERWEEAGLAYREGLQANPLSASLYFNLAQVLERLGQQAAAEEARRTAAVIDPQFAREVAR